MELHISISKSSLRWWLAIAAIFAVLITVGAVSTNNANAAGQQAPAVATLALTREEADDLYQLGSELERAAQDVMNAAHAIRLAKVPGTDIELTQEQIDKLRDKVLDSQAKAKSAREALGRVTNVTDSQLQAWATSRGIQAVRTGAELRAEAQAQQAARDATRTAEALLTPTARPGQGGGQP